MKKDNSTFEQKRSLRKKLVKEFDPQCVLETNGGTGVLWQACYSDVFGIVCEKDEAKVDILAKQRPSWVVYQADCISALSQGYTLDHVIDFVDVDPYGEPWPIIDAILFSQVKLADQWVLVVNDGLRQKLQTGSGWEVKSLAPIVQRYGSAQLCSQYLGIAEELLNAKAAEAKFSIDRFDGYYTGHNGMMTHYAAVLSRTGSTS